MNEEKTLYTNLNIEKKENSEIEVSGEITIEASATYRDKAIKNIGKDMELQGFRNFVRDIKRVKHMLPAKPRETLGHEQVFKKLGKSVTAFTDIKAGAELTLESLSAKIFRTPHIPVRESHKLLGRTVNKDIPSGTPIEYGDLAE